MGEVSFKRNLTLAFHQMRSGQFGLIRKLPGTIYTTVFPKSSHITSNPPEIEILVNVLKPFTSKLAHSFGDKQIFEYLKNSTAHGGDALLTARTFNAFINGRIRKILEVIVWDNGPGIKDLAQVLEQGYSSKKHIFSSLFGAGKGLDLIYRYEDIEGKTPRYCADELIIETGHQKAARRFDTDKYRFIPSGIKVPGTKITARFWL